VKSHSNQTQAGQFTAENALLKNDQQGQDDIKLTAKLLSSKNLFIFLYFLLFFLR
jgi:hypothetical protein